MEWTVKFFTLYDVPQYLKNNSREMVEGIARWS